MFLLPKRVAYVYKKIDRQTDRQTDKQTERHTDKQAGRQADRQTDRQTHTHTDVVYNPKDILDSVGGQRNRRVNSLNG